MSPLASTLGRLAAPPSAQPYDSIRLDLIDQLVTGHARASGHHAWAGAWDQAATALRDAVIAEAKMRLHTAALHSRYPARKLASIEPNPEAAEALRHRLLAEGMRLETFEGQPVDAATDRRRGAALEEAWGGAVGIALTESLRWRSAAGRVATWRRPMRAFWAFAALGLAASAVAAGWLGGQVPAPGWFRPLHEAWWSLPWL
ncbi:MAG: hypothetical protein ABIR59_05075 [Gemmatimonadales bacterium]